MRRVSLRARDFNGSGAQSKQMKKARAILRDCQYEEILQRDEFRAPEPQVDAGLLACHFQLLSGLSKAAAFTAGCPIVKACEAYACRRVPHTSDVDAWRNMSRPSATLDSLLECCSLV